MKTLIIVFSQSGFTRIAAECIRDGLVIMKGQCDIVDLANADPEKFSEYNLIGLGCPVYFYKEPLHVRDFIRNLPDLIGRYWFVFCSHGSIMGITLQLNGVLFMEDSTHATDKEKMRQAIWFFSEDMDLNKASLKKLADLLRPRAGEIKAMAFAHTGYLNGIGPLLEFADIN